MNTKKTTIALVVGIAVALLLNFYPPQVSEAVTTNYGKYVKTTCYLDGHPTWKCNNCHEGSGECTDKTCWQCLINPE